MRRFITFFATGCYSGMIPLAPGTWGTLVGFAFYWLLSGLSAPAYAVTTIAFIAFAVWVSTNAQAIFEEADPQRVVIDEIAGFLVTMAVHRVDLSTAIGGIVLFRIFDIVKPPPIRWIERRFSDGRGVVFDDVMAGIYANAALWFFELLLPSFGVKW
ncbi:MAG TPA: phosphatidylglycerophosphatase A [bacterium]|nr:phosphatidylglycerophosphatase A [bacterium]